MSGVSRRSFLKKALGTGLGTLLATTASGKVVSKIIDGSKPAAKGADENSSIHEAFNNAPEEFNKHSHSSATTAGNHTHSHPDLRSIEGFADTKDPLQVYAKKAADDMRKSIDQAFIDQFNEGLIKNFQSKEPFIKLSDKCEYRETKNHIYLRSHRRTKPSWWVLINQNNKAAEEAGDVPFVPIEKIEAWNNANLGKPLSVDILRKIANKTINEIKQGVV